MTDALHPQGFQLIGGSRIPMLMFGGQVKQGIDSNWHSHAVIPKTTIDLLGLKAFGIPRVDTSASLAGRVDSTLVRPIPLPWGAPLCSRRRPIQHLPDAATPAVGEGRMPRLSRA